MIDVVESRASRRRAEKSEAKADDYKESGFRDRSTYQCAVVSTPRRGYDMFGNPRKGGRFTPDELHARAVERRDAKRLTEKLIADQIKASKEGRRARKAAKKAADRKLYLARCAKPQPVFHMHSAARLRARAASLALAA